MNDIELNIILFIVTIAGALLFVIHWNHTEDKREAEEKEYEGYESHIKKPKILKNDLFVNWMYEYKESEAKEQWKREQQLKKAKEVSEDPNDVIDRLQQQLDELKANQKKEEDPSNGESEDKEGK